MNNKTSTRFAGVFMKADMLIGKRQVIKDLEYKTESKRFKGPYWDVQAYVLGVGLVRYATSATHLVKDFVNAELPLHDKVIRKDWRGLFFEDSVYSLEEENERARRELGISAEEDVDVDIPENNNVQ